MLGDLSTGVRGHTLSLECPSLSIILDQQGRLKVSVCVLTPLDPTPLSLTHPTERDTPGGCCKDEVLHSGSCQSVAEWWGSG